MAHFDNCELADLSLLNESDRHTDKTVLSPYLLNIITNQSQDPLLDITAKALEARELPMLPEKQRRRLLMHFWGGMTFDQIGAIEGCTRQAVIYSVEVAKKNLRKIMGK